MALLMNDSLRMTLRMCDFILAQLSGNTLYIYGIMKEDKTLFRPRAYQGAAIAFVQSYKRKTNLCFKAIF